MTEKLTFDDKNDVYWLGEGEGRDGPYCVKCYDGERKLCRVQTLKGGLPVGLQTRRCMTCGEYLR